MSLFYQSTSVWCIFVKILNLLLKALLVQILLFYCVLVANLLMLEILVSIVFTLATSVFLTKSLFTTLINLHKSQGLVLSLSTSIPSTFVFRLGKPVYNDTVVVSMPVTPLTFTFVAQLDIFNSTLTFPPERPYHSRKY